MKNSNRGSNSIFECQSCGFQDKKWLGRCPGCHEWNSFIELRELAPSGSHRSGEVSKAIPVTDVEADEIEKFTSYQEELDIVLGGGIVRGGLYLIGGSPGVGKSTLLLKMAGDLARSGRKVLYVSGEEGLSQIHLRAKRCGCLTSNLYLLSEIDIDIIKSNLLKCGFEVCVIDSIQTIYSTSLSAAPGSVSQVKEITFELMRLAKRFGISMFIIGHITKEGAIAGPRVLEHMVDCVLYFEGEKNNELKILRGFKNRFGTTSEIGIFEMKHDGLVSAKNASKMFFSTRRDTPGSAAVPIVEGTRVIVVEIQALVSEIEFGSPKRLANGLDTNRLNILLALLEKKIGIALSRHDVFINVVGGIKITETGADLALIASILSSFKNRALKASTAFLGEVSLIGDIRDVSLLELRLKELQSFGFKNVIVPKVPSNFKSHMRCVEVSELSKIVEWM